MRTFWEVHNNRFLSISPTDTSFPFFNYDFSNRVFSNVIYKIMVPHTHCVFLYIQSNQT